MLETTVSQQKLNPIVFRIIFVFLNVQRINSFQRLRNFIGKASTIIWFWYAFLYCTCTVLIPACLLYLCGRCLGYILSRTLKRWGMFLITEVAKMKINSSFNFLCSSTEAKKFSKEMSENSFSGSEITAGICTLSATTNSLNKCMDCVLFWELLQNWRGIFNIHVILFISNKRS